MRNFRGYYAALGKNIRTIRKCKKIRQEWISEQLGMAQSVYNRKERGHVRFNIYELHLLSVIFEKSLYDFLPEVTEY